MFARTLFGLVALFSASAHASLIIEHNPEIAGFDETVVFLNKPGYISGYDVTVTWEADDRGFDFPNLGYLAAWDLLEFEEDACSSGYYGCTSSYYHVRVIYDGVPDVFKRHQDSWRDRSDGMLPLFGLVFCMNDGSACPVEMPSLRVSSATIYREDGTPVLVSEPAQIALFCGGLLALMVVTRRRRPALFST